MRGLEIGVVAIGRHGDAPCRIGRAHRGLHGDHETAGGPGLHRRASATTAAAQRRTAGGGYFVWRCKAGVVLHAAEPRGMSRSGPARLAAWGVSRRRKIAADRRCRSRTACRPIALLKAAGEALSDMGGVTAR